MKRQSVGFAVPALALAGLLGLSAYTSAQAQTTVTFDDVPLDTVVSGTSTYWPDLQITPVWSGTAPTTCATGVPCVVGERGEVITATGQNEVLIANLPGQYALYRAASDGVCNNQNANAPNGNGCHVNGGLAFPGGGGNCGIDLTGKTFVAPPARGFGVKVQRSPSTANPLPLRYEFTPTEGRTLGSFSIDGRDFGDSQAGQNGTFRIELIGYDENGVPVANNYLQWSVSGGTVQSLDQNGSVTSPYNRARVAPDVLPNIFEYGDACTAVKGEPGYFTLKIEAPGMAKVALVYAKAGVPITAASQGDPFFAFDNLVYTVEETCYKSDTAWAAGPRYNQRGGNWATYTPYAAAQTVQLFAGRTKPAGTVAFSAIDGFGNVTITVTLNDGFRFSQTSGSGTPLTVNLAIQGYETAPSGNPAPGQFAFKSLQPGEAGYSAVVTVPAANIYGIHAVVDDLSQEVACPVTP